MSLKPALILQRDQLAPGIVEFLIHAPDSAQRLHPGEFLVLCADTSAQRCPAYVAGFDPATGQVRVVVQEVGASSHLVLVKQPGERFVSVAGPFGRAEQIARYGTVWLVGEGVGMALLLPIARALREGGNAVFALLGARTAPMILMRESFEQECKGLVICTEDGTLGSKGRISDVLALLLEEEGLPNAVYAAGPPKMLRAVCDLTRPRAILTRVFLNALLVDGSGLCGGCRIESGGATHLVCLDGPVFDGHALDFESCLYRASMYPDLECYHYNTRIRQDGNAYRCRVERVLAGIHWMGDSEANATSKPSVLIPPEQQN